MSKLKIGIIGCGSISNVHSASLQALCGEFGAEVAAFADLLPERRAFMEERFPGARQYDHGMKLLDGEKLDIVHICLPTYLHAEYTVAALDRGVNVFVEKPVCLKRSEARQMLEAERRSGKKVMVGQVVRFFDEYKYLENLCRTNEYGKLKSLVLQRLSGGADPRSQRPKSWFREPDKSGTVILDFHIHDVDFMRSLLGEPKGVSVSTDIGAGDQPTHIAAVYQYDDVMAFAEGGWGNAAAYRFRMSYRANFEYATVVYDSWDDPPVTLYDCDGVKSNPEVPASNKYSSAAGDSHIPGVGPYYEEIRYFMERVTAGEPIAKASLADAVKTYELTMGELEMAYAQAGVEFPIKDGE